MLSVSDVSLYFSNRKLFEDVNIKFTPGNCYGVIGANGAGKSTFLKILSGNIALKRPSIKSPNSNLSFLSRITFSTTRKLF